MIYLSLVSVACDGKLFNNNFLKYKFFIDIIEL